MNLHGIGSKKKASLVIWVVFITSILHAGLIWADPPGIQHGMQGLPDIFPADEVVPGLRGYGLTSFRGQETERFEFEVLGTVSFHPRGRVFLVELDHPTLKETGVISGMSGSPMYIGDQLLGAVAYGFLHCTRPIAGITPAGEMLIPFEMEAAGEDEVRGRDARILTGDYIFREVGLLFSDYVEGGLNPSELQQGLLEALAHAPWRAAGWRREEVGLDGIQGMPAELASGFPDARLIPLPLPLTFSGLDIGGLQGLQPLLRSLGFMALQAPNAGPVDNAEIDMDRALVPGRPIGAVLVAGDLDIAGMGTLTFSDGERVAAFGHPMNAVGETDLPLALGYAQAVIPSRLISFRLTSVGPIVGSIIQDRASAIIGEVGREAPMFPVTVNITGAFDDQYSYDVTGHWHFAPFMSYLVAGLSAIRWEGLREEMTVEAISRIKIKGIDEPLVLENVYSGFDPLRPCVELVMVPLTGLFSFPFQAVEIESLELDLSIRKGMASAGIESIRLERRQVRPGDDLRIWVTLREVRGAGGMRHVQEIVLPVPDDAVPGKLARIQILDAAAVRARIMSSDPGLFRPGSLEGLMEMLRVMPDNTKLFAKGDFLRKGLRYNEQPMPDLPASVMNMLEFGTVSGKTAPLVLDVTRSVDTDWVLQGGGTVQVEIIE